MPNSHLRPVDAAPFGRFRVTWAGTIAKSIAIEVPADALYHVWSRYRDTFVGGPIEVTVEEGQRGIRLAQLRFGVRITSEIAAPTPAEAVRGFLYEDRLPGTVQVGEIEVEEIGDPDPTPEAVA